MENDISDMLSLYKLAMGSDGDMELFKELLDKYSMFDDSGIDTIKEENKTCNRKKLKW
tara:strand:- start:355 stop:528 length:174 start_codon:yes stop_codon:yes gene_type:complete